MFRGFFGQQCDVRAAQNHRDAPGLEPACDLVRVMGARRMKGDPYQVNIRGKIHRANLFIHMAHLPAFRNQRCQVRHGDLLEVQETRPADLADLRR